MNAEFNNILNNPLSLISPLTGTLDFSGNRLIGLSGGSEASPGIQLTGDTNTGIRSSGADILEIVTGGADRWQVNASGHLLASDDNAYDIGATGATRPRHYFGSGDITAAGNLALTGSATFSIFTASTMVYSNASKQLVSTAAPTNGQLLIGSTGAVPGLATLTAGTGISITNAAASITIAQIAVAKTADETVNNSSTLQSDDHLLFAMSASKTYFVEITLLLSAANTTADWKFGLSLPASATAFWGPDFLWPTSAGDSYWTPNTTGNTPDAMLTEADTLSFASAGVTHGCRIFAIIRNSTNAGNAVLQWAQNTANSSDSKVLKHSLLKYVELGTT